MSIANSIEALGAIELEEPDEDGPHIDPAATPELRAWIAQRIGAAIPSELAELLGTTSRVFVAGAKLELDDFQDERALGLGELFRVHDYGNGDGLMLELGEPTCRLWWIGHDSWPCTLVARSLAEYLARCVAYAHEVAAYQRDRSARDEPRLPYEPTIRVEPRGAAVDFHGIATPVGVDDGIPTARRGERVTLRRR
jgi:hypothetical protein